MQTDSREVELSVRVAHSHGMLSCLSETLRRARLFGGLSYAHVAIHVVRSGRRRGISESTLSRFETAHAWPEDPDAIVNAYATALNCSSRELWERALLHWREQSR